MINNENLFTIDQVINPFFSKKKKNKINFEEIINKHKNTYENQKENNYNEEKDSKFFSFIHKKDSIKDDKLNLSDISPILKNNLLENNSHKNISKNKKHLKNQSEFDLEEIENNLQNKSSELFDIIENNNCEIENIKITNFYDKVKNSKELDDASNIIKLNPIINDDTNLNYTNKEFYNLQENKLNNQINQFDKISSINFNINKSINNNFETLDVISDNLEVFGYLRNLKKEKNFESEEKFFEIKDNNKLYNIENKNYENTENSNLIKSGKDSEILNNSYDSFYSEKLRFSKANRKKRLSYNSANNKNELNFLKNNSTLTIKNNNNFKKNSNPKIEISSRNYKNINNHNNSITYYLEKSNFDSIKLNVYEKEKFENSNKIYYRNNLNKETLKIKKNKNNKVNSEKSTKIPIKKININTNPQFETMKVKSYKISSANGNTNNEFNSNLNIFAKEDIVIKAQSKSPKKISRLQKSNSLVNFSSPIKKISKDPNNKNFISKNKRNGNEINLFYSPTPNKENNIIKSFKLNDYTNINKKFIRKNSMEEGFLTFSKKNLEINIQNTKNKLIKDTSTNNLLDSKNKDEPEINTIISIGNDSCYSSQTEEVNNEILKIKEIKSNKKINSINDYNKLIKQVNLVDLYTQESKNNSPNFSGNLHRRNFSDANYIINKHENQMKLNSKNYESSRNLMSVVSMSKNSNVKIDKIRELSLGRYMHVFTDIDNDKSMLSQQSSRKVTKFVDTQTDGDLTNYRNKNSASINDNNKRNFQGFFLKEDKIKNKENFSNLESNKNIVQKFFYDNSGIGDDSVSNYSGHLNFMKDKKVKNIFS